ncbi:MAG: right-handed parallel beta-helix repeat-containing protein, partial [Phycisphaerales bacterium]|nr:right-handed parallel beta-helix repeat-containing protein [Phycisphaerales bacterium]
GLQSLDASGYLRNCTFIDNEATGFGGGVYMAGATPGFGACQFTGNAAANGGGVYSNLSYPSFVNCVIDQNTATNGLTGGLCQITSGGGKGGPPNGRTTIVDSNVCGNVPEQQSGWISETNTCFTSECQGDDDGDGLPDGCFGDADGILHVPEEYPTIQDAVDFATDGQVVMIAAGTYEFSGDVAGPEPGPAFYVHGKSITIRGEQNGDGSPAVTILGDESDPPYGVEIRAFPGEEQPVILEHLKISGCIFGVWLDDGIHTVLNCVFENNLIAGMYITSAQVEMTYSSIHDGGTGIWLEGSGADVSLLHCVIEDNSATNRAAGIHAPGGDLSLDRCIVRDNAAYTNQFGEVTTGGLHIDASSSAVLTDTIVCGNLVDDAGAPQIEGPWTDGGGSTASEACGSTIHVPNDYATIQEAVDAAGMFDTIAIASGTYVVASGPGGPGGPSPGLWILDKAITLSGETNSDGSPAVVLQGEGDEPMVFVSNGAPGGEVPPVGFMQTVSLEGLKMSGCDLLLEGWAHAMTNCTVEGGMGGVFAYEVRQLTMTDCIVRDNHGAPWVGVTMAGSGFPAPALTMVNCVVEDNSSQPAGWWRASCGITVYDGVNGGVFSLQDCTIRNNLAISPVDDPGGFAGIMRWVTISDPSLGSATFEGTTVCGNLLDGEPGVQVHGEWTDDGGNTIEDQCPSDCPGDINGDGVVDGADLSTLLGAWGDSGGPADIDGSGLVDGADLAALLGYWGPC